MKLRRRFEGYPCILIATGPSLNKKDVDLIEKYKDYFMIIGCNDSYKVVDFLDIHYAADYRWWFHHAKPFREKYPDLEAWTRGSGYLHNQQYNIKAARVLSSGAGLSEDPTLLHSGHNSGFAQLNFAYLSGCNKFILVGYNMQPVDKKEHFFGSHPDGVRKRRPSNYDKFIEAFNNVQKEFWPNIINCTKNSALSYQYRDLEETLECESSRIIPKTHLMNKKL